MTNKTDQSASSSTHFVTPSSRGRVAPTLLAWLAVTVSTLALGVLLAWAATYNEPYTTAGNYTYDSNLVAFTGTAATLKNPMVIAHTTSSQFNGTLTQAAWQTTLVGGSGAGLQLNAVTSGTYLSPISGAGLVDGGITTPTWSTFTAAKSYTWGSALVGNEANLVALWSLDNTGADSTANALNGTLNNMTFAAGRFGPAGSFNGSNGYVTVPYTVSLQLNTFTISMWVKTSTSGVYQSLYTNYTYTNGGSELGMLTWITTAGTPSLRLCESGSCTEVTAVATVTDGVWHHLAFVNGSSTDHRVYVDGALSVSNTAARNISWPGSGSQFIGAQYTNGITRYLNGLIDEVAVYNTAFTDAQALDLYKRGAATVKYQVQTSASTTFAGTFPGLGIPTTSSGLVSLWRLDETSGTSAADSKGTNTGTLFGSTTWGAGAIGNAASFNGTTSTYIQTAAIMNGYTAGSVSAWIYPNATGANQTAFAQVGPSASQGFQFDYYRTDVTKARFWVGTGVWGSCDFPSPSVTTWHHVAGTWDGATGAFYVDGALQCSFSKSGTISSTNLFTMGNYIGGSSYPFNGLIDDVGLWNTGLTAAQVWTLYQQGLGYVTSGTDLSTTALSKLRYLQYKVSLDTLNTSYRPDVQSITINRTGTTTTAQPVTLTGTGTGFTWLTSFAETVTTPANTAMTYALSPNNGTNWYYVNGSNAWVASDGTSAQSATASTINTNIAAFDDAATTAGTLATNAAGSFKVRGFLSATDGASTPTLDNVAIGYENSTLSLTSPTSWSVGRANTVTWTSTGTTVPNITVEYSPAGTFADTVTVGTNATSPAAYTPPILASVATAKVRVRSATVPALTVTSAAFTVGPGALTSTSVTLPNLSVGGVGNATVAFTTGVAIPSGGKIVVTFPAGFALSSGATTAISGTPTGVTGTGAVAISGQVVTITGLSQAAAGAVSLVLTNIKNPTVAGSTGTYSIKTTTSADIVIDQDTAVAASTIATAFTATETYDTAGNYTYTSGLVSFTGTAATLTNNPAVGLSNSSATFNGTLTSAAWQSALVGGTGAGLQLNAVTSGNYLSPAIDGLVTAPTWGTLTATKSFTWGDPLVGNETNLVGLWHLDNTGTDSTATANNGTLNNISFAAGRFGPAASFNGTNSYIVHGNGLNSIFGSGKALTVSAWVNPSNTAIGTVFGTTGTYPGGTFLIRTNQLAGAFYVYAGGDSPQPNCASVITANTWQHVAVVWNQGSNVSLYVNGVACLSNSAFTNTVSAASITGTDIGTWSNGAYQHLFNGGIDEVAVYNTALTAAQITDLYKRGVATVQYQATTSATTTFGTPQGWGTPTSSSGLLSLWRLDEGTGTTSADSKGTATATLTGSPTWTTGQIGNALSFNGSTAYVSASDAGLPSGAAARTVAMWVKPTTLGTQRWYFSYGTYTTNQLFEIGVSATPKWAATQSGSLNEWGTPTLNTWTHIAVVYDGSTYTYYENGLRGPSGTMTTSTVLGGALNLGREIAGTNYAGVVLDDVGLWNRALTGAEVWDLYNRATYVPSGTDLSTTALPKLRYLQYKVLFDTLNTTYRPDVQSVTVALSGYSTAAQAITPVTGKAFTWLTSFTETSTVPANTSITYALSPNDGTNWYYYTAANWVASDGTAAQATSAATINTNIASFDDQVPTGATGLPTNAAGTLRVRAFLSSTDGVSTPTLSNLDVGYQNSIFDLWGPLGGSSWTVGQSLPVTWTSEGVDIPSVTVEYSRLGDFTDTVTVGTGATSPASYTLPASTTGATAKVRIRSIAAPKLTLDSGAFTVNPGALSGTSVTLASTVAKVSTKATVAFTTATALPLNGKIVVTFPAGFDVSAAAVGTGADVPTGMDGAFAISISGQVVTVTRSGGTASAAGAKTLTLTGVLNPAAAGATGTYSLKTQTSGALDIDTGTAAASTITVGTLTSPSVTPASLVAGATGTVTVGFTMPAALPSGGKIVVTFPAGFTVSGAAYSSATGLTGTGTVAVSSQAVTVSGLSGAAGAATVVLGSVKNPVVSGATGTYALKTTDGGVNDLATGTAAASTITVGALTGASVTPASLVAGATGNATVAFTMANPIPSGGKLVVTFPAGFTVSGAAYSSATGLTGTGTVAVSGQVVTISGLTGSAGASASLVLSGIKNPTVSGTTGTYTLKTTDGTNDIDTVSGVAGNAIVAATLTGTSVQLETLAISHVGPVTVSFTTVNPLPSGGTLVVTFPSGYALNSGGTTAVSGTPSGLSGTPSVSITGQVVTITGLSQTTAGASSLVLTAIKNPTVSGSTGTHQIKTTDSTGTTIDQDLAVAANTISGAIFTVTAPTTGAIWPVTTTQTVKWSVDGPIPTGATVKLSYSADNGSTWTAIVGGGGLDATTGATGFNWPVPLNAASGTAKVKVDADTGWTIAPVTGTSAAYSVTAYVTVIKPNGGEKWAVGAAHTISWQTQGSVANTKLEYSKDSGSTWTTIIASTSNTGSYSWTPVAADAGASLLVRVSSTSDTNAKGVSATSFSVPLVTVTAPTATGIRWLAGSSQTITWTNTAVTNVKLEYSTAGTGGPWTTIIATTPASAGSYPWMVALKTSTTTFIRVSDADAVPAANGTDTALVNALSGNAFAIYGTIAVTAPNTASLEWAASQPQTITWTTSPANANVISNVKIDVTDLINAANNQTIIASTPNHNVAAGSGSYVWSPSFTTTSAKVTISDAADSAVSTLAANAVKLTGVSMTAPAGGETWTVGTKQVLTFGFTGTMTQAKVQSSADNGTTWTTAAAGSLETSPDGITWTAYAADGTSVPVGANPFYLRWVVADGISSVNQAKIRVTNVVSGGFAVSNGFTITGTLTMTTPATLTVGDAATLSWTKVGTMGSVKVEFSPAGTFADTVATVGSNLTGTSTTWTVPDNIGTTGKLRVTDTVTGHPVITNTSSAFTIIGKLTFTAPTASATWANGDTQNITWTTKGTIGTVKLEYATAADSYVAWTPIIATTANTGTFAWNPIPDIVGGAVNPPSPIASPTSGTRSVKLRITDLAHTGVTQVTALSDIFTGKWYLITFNVQNQDAQSLASLNVTDSATWNVTDASLTSPSQTKRYYQVGPATATWSKSGFTAATVSFTVTADGSVTALLDSETPTVFDVKFDGFYDATSDTVRAKAWLFRRGLLINDAGLTGATITIFDGATQKATYTASAPDVNGIFNFSFKAKDAGLAAASSYLVKVAVTYSSQVKTGAGTLNITLASDTKSIINLTGSATDTAAQNTLFGKLTDVKSDIIARMGALGDAAGTSSLFGKLANLDKLLGTASDTGSADSVFGRLVKSQADVSKEVQKGPQTGILNREQFIKSGATATIRYRTTTGLSPRIDVYDAASSKRIAAATMTEIATTGIYEYTVTFDTAWGTGDFTIVVNEATKGSVDSMIMSVMTTDLEAIAKKAGSAASGGGSAPTDLTPILSELQALRGMVTMSAGTGGLVGQVAALQQQLTTMQAQLGLVGAAATDGDVKSKDAVAATAKATMSVRDQLQEIARTMKDLAGPSGLSLHQLFDMQEASVTTAKELQNKIEQIKQATEVTKRIAEEGRQKVQVQTWFESGSVILKILAVNPTDTEQTVPVKAYLPKEVKAEHVMDLGQLKLEYDADRQMHFVTAMVTLKPNESAVFAIEVEDIWQIPQEQLTRLSDDAKAAVKQLAGTEYEERATLLASQIDLKLASVWEKQSDPTLTPEQHIQTYRQNVETMKRLEDDLALLKRMAVTVMNPDQAAAKTPENEFLNKAFSGVQSNWDANGASPIAVTLKSHLTTDTTWRLIFGMLVFVGLMSLAAFLLWQRQAHLAMTAEAKLLQEAETASGSPGPAPPPTASPPGTSPPGTTSRP